MVFYDSKTTLLDLLAGWRKSGNARGWVTVDGEARDAASFKLISGKSKSNFIFFLLKLY